VIPVPSGVQMWLATGHIDMRKGVDGLQETLKRSRRRAGRRKFFDLARLQKAPIVVKAVERIDALFAIEREINGLSSEQRLAVRNERSRPLVAELEI
jgi:hypothetical protein